MCSASIDGVIKIWETETHLPVVVFEGTLFKQVTLNDHF